MKFRKDVSEWRRWNDDETNGLITMVLDGVSILEIIERLPRLDSSVKRRTENAIKSRIGLLYSQGKINTSRGSGEPRIYQRPAIELRQLDPNLIRALLQSEFLDW